MSSKEREELACKYFHDGYNCSQSVAMAFSDILGLEPVKVAELMSGFGGGFGRMREVCGAVSGMTFVTGALSPAADPSNKAERTANYALVQELAGKFKEENGSIVCRELLGLRAEHKGGVGAGGGSGTEMSQTAGASGMESPVPSNRTAAYYHSRPCERMVASATRILAEKIGG